MNDFGRTILLDLVYDYPKQARETSRIKFSDVAAYHFVHTGSAIISDIAEVAITELLKTTGGQLAGWKRTLGGLPHWNDDRANYAAALQEKGYKAWTIDSATGFKGFVIAKSVGEASRET